MLAFKYIADVSEKTRLLITLELKRFWHAVAADDDGSTVFNSARLVKFSHQPAVVQYLFNKHAELLISSNLRQATIINMTIILDLCISVNMFLASLMKTFVVYTFFFSKKIDKASIITSFK
jgi:hypothetical protein